MQLKLDKKMSEDASGQSVMEHAFSYLEETFGDGDGHLDADEVRHKPLHAVTSRYGDGHLDAEEVRAWRVRSGRWGAGLEGSHHGVACEVRPAGEKRLPLATLPLLACVHAPPRSPCTRLRTRRSCETFSR